MFDKKRIKETMLKEGINTSTDANNFMDKALDKLTDEQLKRAYLGAKRKYDKKQNNSSKYVLNYIIMKCNTRGLKL
jgi:hypothetical protein